jgi:hypothetical protein
VSQDPRTRRRYLLLADISRYRAFLLGTELEHANAVVHELTTLIRERLSPPTRFVKLEGDAVFCYADETSFEDGERLIELIESCYFDFSNRLLDMQRATMCRCAACASIGSLDLKFVAHYGTYVIRFDGDREDLAGPDVILVHRLLKNTVGDDGGPQAYAFLTDACLRRMPASVQLPTHSESYESFGRTTGGVHDLEAVIAERREARRAYIASEEADLELSFGEHPYPPAVVWQYFVEAEKRLRWQPLQTALRNHPNRQGRLGAVRRATVPTGPKATHCASTSTGARIATSRTASRAWVAGRCCSTASRPSSSHPPTPERLSATGLDSRSAGRSHDSDS